MKETKRKINYRILVFAAIVGLLFGIIFTGTRSDPKQIIRLRFKVGERLIAIHHWMWGSFALIIIFSLTYFKILDMTSVPLTVFVGFLIGYTFQGLLFEDAFVIVSTIGSFLKVLK